MLKTEQKTPAEVRKTLLEEGTQAAVVDSLLQLATALALSVPMNSVSGNSHQQKVSGTTNSNEEFEFGTESEDNGSPMDLDPHAEEGVDGKSNKLAPMDMEGRPSGNVRFDSQKIDMDLVSVCSSLIDPDLQRKSQDLGSEIDLSSPRQYTKDEQEPKSVSKTNERLHDKQQSEHTMHEVHASTTVVIEHNEEDEQNEEDDQKKEEIDGDGTNALEEATDRDTEADPSTPYQPPDINHIAQSSEVSVISMKEEVADITPTPVDADEVEQEVVDDDEIHATEQDALCANIDEST